MLAILMKTTLGPALGDDADDLGGGYCIYGAAVGVVGDVDDADDARRLAAVLLPTTQAEDRQADRRVGRGGP